MLRSVPVAVFGEFEAERGIKYRQLVHVSRSNDDQGQHEARLTGRAAQKKTCQMAAVIYISSVVTEMTETNRITKGIT